MAQAELEHPALLWQLIERRTFADLDCGMYLYLIALVAHRRQNTERSLAIFWI